MASSSDRHRKERRDTVRLRLLWRLLFLSARVTATTVTLIVGRVAIAVVEERVLADLHKAGHLVQQAAQVRVRTRLLVSHQWLSMVPVVARVEKVVAACETILLQRVLHAQT